MSGRIHGGEKKAGKAGSSARKGVPPLNPSSLKNDKPPTPEPQPVAATEDPPNISVPASARESEERPGAEHDELSGPPLSMEESPPMVTEQEFVHTCNMVQFVAQPALVQVMRSLMEDFVWLVPHVRIRCDQAMGAFLAQQQQMLSPGVGGGFGGNGGMPFMGDFAADGGPPSAMRGMAPGRSPQYGRGGAAADGTSPGASARKGGRRNGPPRGEEETDLCARHGNVRAVKHLMFNAASKQVECIPGFHCLETRVPHASTAGGATLSPAGAPSSSGSTAGAGPASAATTAAFGSAANASASPHAFTSPPNALGRLTPTSASMGNSLNVPNGAAPVGRGTPRSQSQMGMTTPLLPSSTPPSPSKGQANASKRDTPSNSRATPMLQSHTPPPEAADGSSGTADRARLEALLSDLRKT